MIVGRTAIRDAYRDETVARRYVDERFREPLGAMLHQRQARALKRLRWERERAALQREIDRLQELGATQHAREIETLWQRKKDLLHRIEELT